MEFLSILKKKKKFDEFEDFHFSVQKILSTFICPSTKLVIQCVLMINSFVCFKNDSILLIIDKSRANIFHRPLTSDAFYFDIFHNKINSMHTPS